MDTTQILNKLIHFKDSLSNIENELRDIPYDNKPQVVLTMNILQTVINQYLNGSISERELINWANLIECREDIDFDKKEETKIKEIIFDIANPEIMIEGNFRHYIEKTILRK